MTKTNFSSPEFLTQLRSRDPRAVTLLINAYSDHLLNASFGMGLTDSDAEELTQSVWVTFFEKIENFEGRSHIRTYLFGILYNKAKELYRSHEKHTSKDPIDEIMESKFDDKGHWNQTITEPEKFVHSAQTMEIIKACLESLPHPQKMAFYFKEWEGTTTEEICKILGVTSTNLGVLLYRAKNKLRVCIEGKTK